MEERNSGMPLLLDVAATDAENQANFESRSWLMDVGGKGMQWMTERWKNMERDAR